MFWRVKLLCIACVSSVKSTCPAIKFAYMFCVTNREVCTKTIWISIWISFSALTNYPCCKDHVEEERIKSHDRLQRGPFTSLIAPTSPQLSNVMDFCLACVHCTAHDQTYIESASISWLKWSLLNELLVWTHVHISTCFFLDFSFVEIGNLSLMGVSPIRLCETGFKHVAPSILTQ